MALTLFNFFRKKRPSTESQALLEIKHELKVNIDSVGNTLNPKETLLRQLEDMDSPLDEQALLLLSTKLQLKSDAFDSAWLETKLPNTEKDIMVRLSKLYAAQEHVAKLDHNFVEQYYTHIIENLTTLHTRNNDSVNALRSVVFEAKRLQQHMQRMNIYMEQQTA